MRKIFTPEQESEIIQMYQSGMNYGEIAETFPFEVSSYTVGKTLRRHGVPTKKGSRSRTKPARGADHPWWKGGWRINSNGYKEIRLPEGVDDLGARASSRHYALEHRWVMAQTLGRRLLPDENIHHKNGVRTDNRPENLELWVVSQPCGQRPEDLLAWAWQIIEHYEGFTSPAEGNYKEVRSFIQGGVPAWL